MSESLKRLKNYYEPRIRSDRPGYEILDWEDQESQFCRFEVLLRRVELAGKRILDLGCGVGDLCAYLTARGIEADYTGVDILESMINEACHRCPDAHFVQTDLLEENPFGDESFDVAFCSGIFNLETGDNEELLLAFLGRLKELIREAVVVNLLSVASPAREERYHYFDPDKVLSWAESLFADVEIDLGYLSNDFTLICRHSRAPD